jgi:myo-inositol-1(or 4)-monophosphatase
LPGHDLDLLIDAAHQAGVIARRHFGAAPRVWDKGQGQGPVTEADLEIDRFLHAHLLAAHPDYGWLSEESTDSQDRLSAPATFIVDPIDGTRAFIDGQPGFAHALAVVRDGQPMAAVVYLPMLDLTYSAVTGGGAWLNGRPLQASTRRTLTGARVLVNKLALDPALWPGGVPLIDRHFRPSLAWRLAMVGAGEFDAMLTLRNTWDWDIAAAALIATESGALVTTPDGMPLIFNRATPGNPGVIAAPPVLHAALLAAKRGGSALQNPVPTGLRGR